MMKSTERAKKLLAGITPGEWYADIGECAKVRDSDGVLLFTGNHLSINGRRLSCEVAADMCFIAAAPGLVRELCEEVEAAENAIFAVHAALTEKENLWRLLKETETRAAELERQRNWLAAQLSARDAESGGKHYSVEQWIEWAEGSKGEGE